MRRRVLPVVALAAALAALAPQPAIADRAPTKAERAAIKRAVLARCKPVPEPCRFRSARVSTRNRRYAWANVVREGLSGMLLRRPTSTSRRFRVMGIQGGGISECAYWRKRAPRSVLGDLDIHGLIDISSGTEGNCG